MVNSPPGTHTIPGGCFSASAEIATSQGTARARRRIALVNVDPISFAKLEVAVIVF